MQDLVNAVYSQHLESQGIPEGSFRPEGDSTHRQCLVKYVSMTGSILGTISKEVSRDSSSRVTLLQG